MELKESDRKNGEIIFEDDRLYIIERYYYQNRLKNQDTEEVDWCLTEYEQLRKSNNEIRFKIVAYIEPSGKYKEYTMYIKDIIHRIITVDSENRILHDSICDKFLNSINSQKYVAYGSAYPILDGYDNQEPGPNIYDYLQSEQIFINHKDSKDIYQNRWLLNKFFESFIETNDSNYHRKQLPGFKKIKTRRLDKNQNN